MELTGYGSVLGHQGDGSVRSLGYCPQENVLWPILTAREHLEVFAAVKGLRKADASVAISRYCAVMRFLCAKMQGDCTITNKEWRVGMTSAPFRERQG